ncbi:MAG: hypothetical protein IJQ99_03800 [Synergistaceae bacterium]|nr:hypothetical protein [Synergistaceae bacterium]
MQFELQFFGGRGSSGKKDIIHKGYENGFRTDFYDNSGYKAITKLPLNAEFTVVRSNGERKRYVIQDVDGDGKRYLWEIGHDKRLFGLGTYILPAVYNNLIEERKYVEGLPPENNIRRMIGRNATQIIIHNRGKPLHYKNRKTPHEWITGYKNK